MDEIEIQIVDPESRQARIESRFDSLGPMIGIPQFCGDKEVFTRDPRRCESGLQPLAHLTLVPVSFRTIEVSKSSVQRVSGSGYRRGRIGNQGAKAKYGYMAGSMGERHCCSPKIRRFDYQVTLGV